MDIREAAADDAEGMSQVLRDIIALTGKERPSDPAFVFANYISNPAGIRCTVAVDEAGAILGFQSLVRAVPGNRYGLAEGWGFIGTHISPRAHRRGVGTILFQQSQEAAREAGLVAIDAFIGSGNTAALRYYDAQGFRTYREEGGVTRKAFDLSPAPAA